jgi:hypothetical protein
MLKIKVLSFVQTDEENQENFCRLKLCTIKIHTRYTLNLIDLLVCRSYSQMFIRYLAI